MTAIPNLEVQQADGSFAVQAANQHRISVVLEAGVASEVVVPQDDDHTGTTNFAFFGAEAPFYADYTTHADVAASLPDTDAVIPGVSITDGSGPDFSPTTRRITNVAKISLISRTAQVVTITFYL